MFILKTYGKIDSFKKMDIKVILNDTEVLYEGKVEDAPYNVPISVDTIRRRYPIKWTYQEGIGTLIVNTKIWVF